MWTKLVCGCVLMASLPFVPVISVAIDCNVSDMRPTTDAQRHTLLLPGSHHSGAKQLSDLAAIKLDQTKCIVTVVVFSAAGLDCSDADSADALDTAVLAEEPKGQVDVLNRAVNENAAGELGVLDEETGRVEFVASLTSEDRRDTDHARTHFLERVAV